MFNNPFLQNAVDSKNRRQQLDHLLRITAPHERIVLTGIALILIALLAWALFGSVARSVTVDGVLIEPGVRHEVVANEPGHLVEFLVAPGDLVRAGEPIARQSVPDLDRETAVLRNRVNRLEAEAGRARDNLSHPLLAAARVALLQMEARRSAREIIVSGTGGKIMALRSARGGYLAAGTAVVQLRDSEHHPLQAALALAPTMAGRVRSGMQASVEIAMPDGAKRLLAGEVAAVAAGPLPGWLAALLPAATGAHRVDIVLKDRASDLALAEGTPCRVRILLGRHAPAALFNS